MQVTWDDPESSQNVNRVSPWQVEYIPLAPLIDPDFPPSKRFKVLQDSGMLPSELTRSMAGHLNSTVFNYSPFPAGMQGARRDNTSISHGLSNTNGDNFHHTVNELPKNDNEPELKSVSTALSIGSSYSDILSPLSQSSVHFGGADLLGQPGHSSSSFQLFGKVIQLSKPIEGGSKHNAGCTNGGEKRNVHRE